MTKTARHPARRRALLAAGVVLVLLVAYAGYAVARPTVLRTELDIDAPPDQVWSALTDRDGYPEWNPFIVSSTGELTPGATITNVLRDTEGQETTFTPEVLAVVPGRELRWIGRITPGWIFDGEHEFRLESRPGGRTRLIQQETFRGVAVPLATGTLRDTIEPQFHAMNRAVAEKARSLSTVGPA